jgi:hypothetical protein
MLANEYNGFALFSDVEDEALKAFNRGRVLCNIFVDNQQDGKTNAKGAALILGYFSKIPSTERAMAQAEFLVSMKKEGFVINAS